MNKEIKKTDEKVSNVFRKTIMENCFVDEKDKEIYRMSMDSHYEINKAIKNLYEKEIRPEVISCELVKHAVLALFNNFGPDERWEKVINEVATACLDELTA